MTPRKPQPPILGMAADMQLARQELFNPKQFDQLQKQIAYAKAMEQFTMSSEVVTIDLRPCWKQEPVMPVSPPPPKKVRKPSGAPQKSCPHCGGLFTRVGMHLRNGCKAAG